jgi:hypothetical protein
MAQLRRRNAVDLWLLLAVDCSQMSEDQALRSFWTSAHDGGVRA